MLQDQSCSLPADQADQCDKGSFAAVTASLVNDVHSLLSSQTPLQIPPEASEAVRNLNRDSIVLVAHSYGGVAAVDMLAGKLLVGRKIQLPCCLLCKAY